MKMPTDLVRRFPTCPRAAGFDPSGPLANTERAAILGDRRFISAELLQPSGWVPEGLGPETRLDLWVRDMASSFKNRQ